MNTAAVDEPGLPDREGKPAFAEPWQAEAFAAVVQLGRAGLFTWSEWVNTLGRTIARDPQRADEDSDTAYYRQWLAAFEQLLVERGVLTPRDIAETAEHWRRSYLHTPHGAPITLRRDWNAPSADILSGDDEHDHDAPPRKPVAVSLPS